MDDLSDFSSDSIRAAAGGARAANVPAPIRNNNPGALMPGGKLAQYASPEEGMAALDSNLKSYGKAGVNTLEGVISRWAPPSENDTQAYIAHAARVTGLDPKAPIDLTNNPYVRQQLMAAIIQHENGRSAVNGGAPATQADDPFADFSSSSIRQAAAHAPPVAPTPASSVGNTGDVFGEVGSAARDVIGQQLTGLGSSIVGGYKGLYEAGKSLAQNYDPKQSVGDNLRAAADTGANAVTDYQRGHTYQPEAGSMGDKAAQAFNSDYNPLNLPNRGIDYLADKTAEHLGPGAGTTVKAVGTGALLALGLRGKPGATAPIRATEVAPLEAAAPAAQTLDTAVQARQAAAAKLQGNMAGDGFQPAVPGAAPAGGAGATLASQFAARQAAAGQPVSGLQSAGAAATDTATTLAELKAQASPELAAKFDATPATKINLDAARTAVLEEKHGIDLINGQRSGKTADYADQYNNRGAYPQIGAVLQEQPKQVAAALDNVRAQLAPDIYDHGPNAIGQTEMDGFVAHDRVRNANIDSAYRAIQDKYEQLRAKQGLPETADFPVDGNTFVANAREALAKNSATYDLPAGIASELADIVSSNGAMSFEKFMSLNKSLATKIREGKGSERAAAYIVKDELQKLPLVGGAAELKPLVDRATGLARERFETIRNVPGYKEAVGGASSAQDAMEGIGSASADTFHRKYVTNGSAADVQRMVNELGRGSKAHQAMAAGEIEALKNKAGLASENPDLRPKALNDYLYQSREKANTLYGGEGTQSLSEINELTNKIGMPKTGVFNHSNTTSSALSVASKYGGGAVEMGLAGATHGASVPVVAAIKAAYAAKKSKAYGANVVKKGSGISTDD